MSCLWSTFASVWVRAYESLLARPAELSAVTEGLTRSKILQDLETTEHDLECMESQLVDRISGVRRLAAEKASSGDKNGARKKLFEKRALEQQLDKLRGSQHIISMHIGTIQGAELNQALITTLKASGNAMRLLAPHRDVKEVEDVVFDLQDEMRRASEVNDVLSRPIGSVGDDVLGVDGATDDVEEELRELLGESPGKVAEPAAVAPARVAGASTEAPMLASSIFSSSSAAVAAVPVEDKGGDLVDRGSVEQVESGWGHRRTMSLAAAF